MSQAALIGFNWNELEPETKAHVQAATARLHMLERRTGEAIIEIGRTLIEVRSRDGMHGHFRAWLETEFGWSHDTARNFMNVANQFGDITKISSFAPSALYALASGNMPEPIREEFIAKAEAGERVTHKDVKQRLAVVDLDSGEIDPEPIESEPFDGPVFTFSSQRQTHPIALPVNNSARVFSDSLVAAQAPAVVAQAVADAQFKVRGALRLIRGFMPGVIAEHGDSQDTRERLDDVIDAASQLRDSATSLRDQLRAGERLRAVK